MSGRYPRKYVRGGHGDDCRRIGRELLQPVGRWTPHRKLHLLEGIAAGHITQAEAMAAHGISAEEMGAWWPRAAGGPRALAVGSIPPNGVGAATTMTARTGRS